MLNGQAVARETNYSETTFVMAEEPREGGWDVRIFTPTEELPFAGHPTLGTAWLLRHRLSAGLAPSVRLHLGVGPVDVRFDDEGDDTVGWLAAPPIRLGQDYDPAMVAGLLGLAPGRMHPSLPSRFADIGPHFILAPLADPEALASAWLDAAAWRAWRGVSASSAMGVFVFCPGAEGDDHDFAARLFFDAGGVREDPATGSANACLAAYLLEHEVTGPGPVTATVVQGVEMGRPSLLRLCADRGAHGPEVSVGGRVRETVRGTIRV
jgi:trans-2,3-dihydro-3-hydroxyanthranilate isomerase